MNYKTVAQNPLSFLYLKLSSTHCPFYDRFRKKGAVLRLFGAKKFDEKKPIRN